MKFPYMWIAAVVFLMLAVAFGVQAILEFRKEPIDDGRAHPLLGFLGFLTFACLGVGIRILIFIFLKK